MNGNPHYEDYQLDLDNAGEYDGDIMQLHATLALAYEARTANLLHALEISYRAQGSGLRVDSTDILTRLGFNEGDTK